ncbi:hypothetical protein HDU97_009095 [Phlyctochytrium planicorne]|nr:hypothetical protein HDU97_009095 [Phlyctochytrium planicorne]
MHAAASSRLPALLLLLMITATSAADLGNLPAKTNVSCSIDDDCKTLNLRLPRNGGVAAYACVESVCAFVVGTGEICKKASDCTHFQWVSRQLRKNVSIEAIVGRPVANVSAYLDALCSPTACTIASNCNSFSDPLFNTKNQLLLPEYIQGQACCVGGAQGETCSTVSGVATCGLNEECSIVSADVQDNTLQCVPANLKKKLWVGVLLTVLSAIFTNMGLNVQKLALRKRHEKKQEKKLERRMKIIQRLAAIKLAPIRLPSFSGKRSRTPSFQNLFSRSREGSSASQAAAANAAANAAAAAAAEELEYHPRFRDHHHAANAGRDGRTSVQSDAAHSFAATDQEHYLNRNGTLNSSRPASRSRYVNFGIELPRPTLRITDKNTISATVTKPDGTTEDISIPSADEDKAEFSKKLNFGSLLKNPIWLLGFLVFVVGNLLNFGALQFAPQSLVATLGSVSLVVNVILAPIINREKFTWRDVMGVVLIVSGSSMTVVFSGVQEKDYKLCVLLALFRRVATIIFLTATVSLVAIIFLLICFIEKNLDLKPAVGDVSVTTTSPVQETTIRLPANRESVLAWTSKMSSRAYELPGVVARRTSDVFRGLKGGLGRGRGSFARESVEGDDGAGVPMERVGEVEQQNHHQHQHQHHHGDLVNAVKHEEGIPEEEGCEGKEEEGGEGKEVKGKEESAEVKEEKGEEEMSPTSSESTANGESLKDEGDVADEGFLVSPTTHIPLPHDPRAPVPAALSQGDGDRRVLVTSSTMATTSDSSMVRPSLDGADQFNTLHSSIPDAPTDMIVPGHPVSAASTHLEVPRQSFSQYDDEIFVVGTRGEEVELQPGKKPANGRPNVVTTTTVIGMDEAMAAEAASDENAKPSFKQRIYKSMPPFFKRAVEWWQTVDILPRLKKRIPLDSVATRIILPFSYASLGGLMGTLTVLFAKATVHLLTSSLFEGENQYNELFAWVITGVTVVTAVSQIYWINMGLQRYDALLQIPVYYVVWTVFDVVGGGVYFNEFEGFNARQYGLFVMAVGIIFIGVFVLGDRLKGSHV